MIGTKWGHSKKKAGKAELLNPPRRTNGTTSIGPMIGGTPQRLGVSAAATSGKAEANGKAKQMPARSGRAKASGNKRQMTAMCGGR